MWLSIEEFANLTRSTKQAIYKKIKQNKLKTKEDEIGNILVELAVEQNNIVSQQEEIKKFYSGIMTEYKKQTDSLIEELKKAHERELHQKDKYHDEIIKMKNDKIKELEYKVKELEKGNKKGLWNIF